MKPVQQVLKDADLQKEEIHEIWNEERKSIEKGLPKAYVTFKVKNTIRKNDKSFIRA